MRLVVPALWLVADREEALVDREEALVPDASSLAQDMAAVMLGSYGGDPFDVYAQLRRTDSAVWIEGVGSWAMSRWSDVTAGLEDTTAFGAYVDGIGSNAIYGRTMQQMEGVEHKRKTAIVARRIRNPALLRDQLRPRLRNMVGEFFTGISVVPSGADLKALVTSRFPREVVADVMSMHDATDFPTLCRHIISAAVSNVARDPAVHSAGERARDQLFEWLTPQITSRRKLPTDDLLSDMASDDAETPLDDDEVRATTDTEVVEPLVRSEGSRYLVDVAVFGEDLGHGRRQRLMPPARRQPSCGSP